MTHPRTKVVLQSRQFSASSCTDCSAYSSCSTKFTSCSLGLLVAPSNHGQLHVRIPKTKASHTQSTQSNRWFFPNSVPSHGQLYVQNPKQNKSYPGNPIRLDGFQTKTTCVSLGPSHARQPTRRAEATGHLQLKVKCSCCGHAQWVVFSKSKPFLPTFGVLLRAKTAKLFLVGQCIFLAVCAVHSDARRSMPPDKSKEWFTQRLWQGWTRWNNGRRGWFS